MRAFARASHIADIEKVDPIAFAAHLIDLMRRKRPSTRRQYRSAVGFAARERNTADWETAASMIEEARYEGKPRLPNATSSAKARRIYAGELEEIEGKLSDCTLLHGEELNDYLDAGLAAGLRPVEWMRARVVVMNSFAVLIVRNAKQDEQRGHGRFRRLVWKLPDATAEIEAIERHLAAVRARLAGIPWDARRKTMEAFNRSLGDTLRQVQEEVWGDGSPNIALYTVRHEFASRAKAHLSPQEVAALMGHRSDATATRDYGQPPRGGGRRPKSSCRAPTHAIFRAS